MRKRMKDTWEAMKLEIQEHKASFAVYLILRALVIAVMILEIFNRNYEAVFFCVLTLLLLVVPSFIQVEFKIELPITLEVIILVFIFSHAILGEISAFYIKFPMWDTILHTINGFLAAAIGFSLVDIMNNEERIQFKLSPLFMAIVAFSFSMTIGILWEFFEFFMDVFLHMDMQKDTIIHHITSVNLDPTQSNIAVTISGIKDVIVNGESLGLGGYLDIGLIDTMEDLLVNFIGAVVFSIFGFIYVKKRGKGNFVRRFIPQKKDGKKDYLQNIRNKYRKHDKKS